MDTRDKLNKLVATVAASIGFGQARDKSIRPLRTATAPYVRHHIAGTAGDYGKTIVGTKKYRSWKRKTDRRARNARGGK